MSRRRRRIATVYVAGGLLLATIAGLPLAGDTAAPSAFAWYCAAEAVGDEGAPAQPGDRVLRLRDMSGNGRDLVAEVSAGNGPVLREDPVTGSILLSFSGAEHLQSETAWGVLKQPATLILAARIHRTSHGYLFDSREAAGGRQALLAGDRRRVSRWQVWAGEGLAHEELAVTHHMEVHTVIFNGDQTQHFIHGEQAVSGSAGEQDLAGFTLGARHDLFDGHFLHGDIGEVRIFEGVLPPEERRMIERELEQRYLPRDLVDVFVGGTDGYHTYRIPVLWAASDGTLLAFAEGRSRRSDQSRNDIVLRRSEDGGETWGPLQIIADHGDHALNDPTVVADAGSGRIFLFFHEYPFGYHAGTIRPGFEGEGVHRTFLTFSDDEGLTWSEAEDITRSVKRSANVTYLGSGPGIGIQLENGPHAGRLVIPFRERGGVFAVFSDDGGRSWQAGETARNLPPGAANEPQMVELADGRVLVNARNAGGEGFRKIAISEDGGATWGKMRHDEVLIEPECQASLLRVSIGDRDDVLLFLNPASREKGDEGRVRGLLRASFDDGKTWPVDQLIYPGQFSYSAMAQLEDGQLAVLFERDFGLYWIRQKAADHGKDPMRISFRRVSLQALLNGKQREIP
jgi:sialidase-1